MKHNFVFVGISQSQCNDEFPIVTKYRCINTGCGVVAYLKYPGLIKTKQSDATIDQMNAHANIVDPCPGGKDAA